MARGNTGRPLGLLIWAAVVGVTCATLIAAATSPLLAWREPVYIVAGFAGIVALILMLWQPLLARGYLSGVSIMRSRGLHRLFGLTISLAIILHIAGLWITSPPDVMDALLFASPTPFAVWGVIGMWVVFATAILAMLRRRLRMRPLIWRRWHGGLTVGLVISSVLHAILIEGTMGPLTKGLLSGLVVLVTLAVWIRRPA